jgi:hypothetical protein
MDGFVLVAANHAGLRTPKVQGNSIREQAHSVRAGTKKRTPHPALSPSEGEREKNICWLILGAALVPRLPRAVIFRAAGALLTARFARERLA